MIDQFVHRYEPGSPSDPTTLLLFHGTGGNESSLISLGRAVAPTAALLSPRGRVLEHGMPRFFRRIAEGVFDLEDLRIRTDEMAEFIRAAATHYKRDPTRFAALGFSNGANIAGSLLLRQPGLILHAILFRAMVPFEPEHPPALTGTRVLLSAGRHDPLVPVANVTRLAEILKQGGAEVDLVWQEAGHQLVEEEVQAAADWLGRAS